jgi:hypothetical protein
VKEMCRYYRELGPVIAGVSNGVPAFVVPGGSHALVHVKGVGDYMWEAGDERQWCKMCATAWTALGADDATRTRPGTRHTATESDPPSRTSLKHLRFHRAGSSMQPQRRGKMPHESFAAACRAMRSCAFMPSARYGLVLANEQPLPLKPPPKKCIRALQAPGPTGRTPLAHLPQTA